MLSSASISPCCSSSSSAARMQRHAAVTTTPAPRQRHYNNHRRHHQQQQRGAPAAAAPAAAAAVSAAAAEELAATAQALADLSTAKAEQATIDAAAAALAERSAAAGANVVRQQINDGSFKGFTLSGQTAQRFSSVITLGVLSFNMYQPADLKIKIAGTDAGGVFKGRRGAEPQAYVIATPFEVVEVAEGAEGAEGEATPTGVRGRSLAVGTYEQVADNPQRLTIRFKEMQLEPEPGADLARWLDTFGALNPQMDKTTGVLTVALPEKSPVGFMDYLLMVDGWQLVKGNFGSVTLLQRVAG